MRRVLPFVLVLLLGADAAWADYEVRGRFRYRDRGFTLGGFTGVDPDLPIRFADVEVIDANSQAVLASGSTDETGLFAIQVNESQTRNVQVRVLSTSNDAGVPIRVLEEGSGAIYAVSTSVFSNHPSNQDIDFTLAPIVALQFQGGEPFNVFDQAVDAMDFIRERNGSYPSPGQRLTLYWKLGTDNGTYFSSFTRSVFLLGLSNDSDGYDDSVILHEIGHYVEFVLADSDNTGGPHTLNGCYKLTLTWSEGFATAFQNMVREWQGLNRPDIYVDTAGQPGPGQAFISYNVEGPSTGIPGSGNEVAVNAVLWDIVDDTTTLDGSPGVDDDGMQVADATTRVWDVITNYLPLPSVTTISIEDFWEGWFARNHGFATQMAAIFESEGMRFADDEHEPDDTPAQARDGGTLTQATQHSISGNGDQDWTRFDGIGGSEYEFQTVNLTCGSDTRLDLYDSDGTTLLASNDDRSGNDLSSRILWTATKTGDLYLRVIRPGSQHEYTTYDLFVDVQVPVLVSDVQITSTPDGVQLEWRAEREAGFSHFDLERSAERTGPFARINDAPIVSVPGDSNRFEYLDGDARMFELWFYRIVGVDDTGEESVFGPFQTTAAPLARVALHAPRPNPFNPNTTLRFDLPNEGRVSMRVFNTSGRLVRTLIASELVPAGIRFVVWDGQDDDGRAVGSGVYLVSLEALGVRLTQRAVVVR